jgi:integrase/recombinase XerD
MNEHVHEFLEYGKRKKYKAHTIYDYRATIGEFFRFLHEIYPDVTEITNITRDMVLNYEKHLMVKKDSRGKTMTRNRRKRYLLNLRTFFNYLQKEEKIYKNPAANLAIPRDKRTIIKDVLSVDEMERLLKSCEGDSAQKLRDRAILELLYSSGIRADELCAIEIDDIDLHEHTLFVRKGKWGSERLIPFGHPAGQWITRYREKSRPLINDLVSELLFVSMRGRRLQPQALCDLVKKYAYLAGIEKNVTTHTFRHSCAVHMLKGNADIRYVQKQLGHKRISTTERYLKIEITDLKEAHERYHPREQEDW